MPMVNYETNQCGIDGEDQTKYKRLSMEFMGDHCRLEPPSPQKISVHAQIRPLVASIGGGAPRWRENNGDRAV